ncbi:MAG: hypothetical protein IJW40_06935 [Clostridia bacterium]|nr:hypothetical protein [Clostridia bacterium]
MNLPPLPNLRVKVVAEANPWDDRDALPTLSPVGVCLLSLICVACAVYPAVATLYPSFWWLPVLLSAIFYLRANRTFHGWLLLVVSFLLGTTFGGAAAGATVICIISTVALTAFLYTTTRHPLLICLPIVAYAITAVLSSDMLTALFSLPCFPAAYILGRKIMQNEGRVSAICSSALVLGGVSLFLAALLWRLSGTEMSFDALSAAVSELHAKLLDLALHDESFALLRMQFEGTEIPLADVLSQLFTLVLLLSPGIIVIVFLAIAYAAQYLCVMSYPSMGMKQFCTLVARRFIMSIPSALIFVACSLIALFFFSASKITVFLAVSQNLWLILFPGMLIVGAWSLYSSYCVRPSPLYLVLALVAALFMPPIFLIFVALTGATTTLTRPLLLRIAAIMKAQNGDHDDKSGDGSSH